MMQQRKEHRKENTIDARAVAVIMKPCGMSATAPHLGADSDRKYEFILLDTHFSVFYSRSAVRSRLDLLFGNFSTNFRSDNIVTRGFGFGRASWADVH
jgi:hypothetical protein